MSPSSCLLTVKWFPILQYHSHNLASIFCLHTVYSIWPIDRIISVASIPDQTGPGSNDNERVLRILQISKTGVSPSDCLISLSGHCLGKSHHSAEIQSVYSEAPADKARFSIRNYPHTMAKNQIAPAVVVIANILIDQSSVRKLTWMMNLSSKYYKWLIIYIYIYIYI